ncbi:AraC family transcriptional regulator [Pseudomonas sp. gcc21]|uniref:AraC family transcriptional regulator n=1 Tax=Pseudomonas sp. gcc21 TaxID=2726989 RepID=UPI00145233CF|nr:AraC family transcriptional regulator [Pseudomonas sp. gcc21]QJD58614.1 AraC family transcriptional regulator [Pseudomonas sp. gcc21]
MKLGDLAVGHLYSLQAALNRLGQDPQPLFARYGVTSELLAQPQARISIPRFMRLGHAAIRQSGRPEIGLLMGQQIQISHFGLAGMAAQCAPSMHEAFATLVRYERLTSQNYRGHSGFAPPALQFYSISPYNAFNLFVVDSALAARAQLGKHLTSGQARVREVHIEFPAPAYAEAYEACFQCPVLFGQSANQLLWDPASLELPLVQSAPATFAQLVQLCERELEQLDRHRRIREKVEEIVSPELHRRLPTLSEVAEQLGMPTWTLRRRLQAEAGTRFQDIVNETRRDLAVTYIRDTDLALGEIAFLLGFSSQGAFQRGFRKWTGQPPGAFRRQYRHTLAAENTEHRRSEP